MMTVWKAAKAQSHPLRVKILRALAQAEDDTASPNELAETLRERLPNVSYHIRALLDLECIELVRTAQRRGAIEHYYRLKWDLGVTFYKRPRKGARKA